MAETRGTVFHGKHHDEETIIECLAMLADRNSLAAIHRIKGVKEETVTGWLKQIEPQTREDSLCRHLRYACMAGRPHGDDG